MRYQADSAKTDTSVSLLRLYSLTSSMASIKSYELPKRPHFLKKMGKKGFLPLHQLVAKEVIGRLDQNQIVFLRAPLGSGKTVAGMIAALYYAGMMKLDGESIAEKKKVLIVTPTKARSSWWNTAREMGYVPEIEIGDGTTRLDKDSVGEAKISFYTAENGSVHKMYRAMSRDIFISGSRRVTFAAPTATSIVHAVESRSDTVSETSEYDEDNPINIVVMSSSLFSKSDGVQARRWADMIIFDEGASLKTKFKSRLKDYIVPNQPTLLLTGSDTNEVVSLIQKGLYSYSYYGEESRVPGFVRQTVTTVVYHQERSELDKYPTLSLSKIPMTLETVIEKALSKLDRIKKYNSEDHNHPHPLSRIAIVSTMNAKLLRGRISAIMNAPLKNYDGRANNPQNKKELGCWVVTGQNNTVEMYNKSKKTIVVLVGNAQAIGEGVDLANTGTFVVENLHEMSSKLSHQVFGRVHRYGAVFDKIKIHLNHPDGIGLQPLDAIRTIFNQTMGIDESIPRFNMKTGETVVEISAALTDPDGLNICEDLAEFVECAHLYEIVAVFGTCNDAAKATEMTEMIFSLGDERLLSDGDLMALSFIV